MEIDEIEYILEDDNVLRKEKPLLIDEHGNGLTACGSNDEHSEMLSSVV